MTPEMKFLIEDAALYGAMVIFAIGAFASFCAVMQAKWGNK